MAEQKIATFSAFEKINIDMEDGILTATFNNPPVNVLDGGLMIELFKLCALLENDRDIKVVIFQSANKEIFLAHGDINFVTQPETFGIFDEYVLDNGLNPMQQLHMCIASLPQITIGKLRGYMRGGGHEFALSLDMRFAVEGATWFAQPEAKMGIIPGGGGTQFLTALIGKARAMEIILGAELIHTRTASEYGLINRALPNEEIDVFVKNLAITIARHQPDVASSVKKAVQSVNDFQKENQLLGLVFSSPQAASIMSSILENGAQTLEGEINLEKIIESSVGY